MMTDLQETIEMIKDICTPNSKYNWFCTNTTNYGESEIIVDYENNYSYASVLNYYFKDGELIGIDIMGEI